MRSIHQEDVRLKTGPNTNMTANFHKQVHTQKTCLSKQGGPHTASNSTHNNSEVHLNRLVYIQKMYVPKKRSMH